MLDCGAPLDEDIDWDALASDFADMTGANIRNAAIAAAFIAAETKKTITIDHIYRAARAEYRAMGRVFSGGERML